MKSPPLFRIAALLPSGPEYAERLLEGAIDYAQEISQIELIDIPYQRESGPPCPDELENLDGALVWLQQDECWVDELIKRGVVVVNTSGDRIPDEIPLVAFKGSHVVKEAVAHFAELNLRDVVYIGEDTSSNPTLQRRFAQFKRSAEQKRMKASEFEIGANQRGIEDRSYFPAAIDQKSLDTFLLTLSGPTGVWCQDDFIARFVCDRAAALNLDVPGDLAVLGLDDYRIARTKRPTISSIPQPGQLIGYRAVGWIHECLREEKPCRGIIALHPPPVEARESTLGQASDTRIYRQALKTIREHACRGLTVDELMQSIPMSQPTFSKRFSELYGLTPGSEIRRVRLDQARHYLCSTSFSVERVANLCGFEQSGKFSTFFKRETGTTPSAFRHSQSKKD